MSPIRTAGSALGVITGVWTVFVQYSNLAPAAYNGLTTTLLAVIGAFLFVDAAVSFYGLRSTFILGVILSGLIVVLIALLWKDFPSDDSASVLVLSLVTLLADIVASRPARALSEKDSPLNLPVFG